MWRGGWENKLKLNRHKDYMLRMGIVLTKDMLDVKEKIDGARYMVDVDSSIKIVEGAFVTILTTNDGCKLDGCYGSWIHACSCQL